MKRLFRPSILVAVSAALVVGAAILVLAPAGPMRPTPSALGDNDGEIVWLYSATNPSAWERFVASVKRAAVRVDKDFPGVKPQLNGAFPKQSTAVPEVALEWPGQGKRLVFRWYKLTSDWKTRDWVEALLKTGRRPPLAVIGGNTSDGARELARQLQLQGAGLPPASRPLLLLTTATADNVAQSGDGSEAKTTGLTQLYPDRTFRFCFSNRQMASAVTQFIWTQEDLRPDAGPIHMVEWDDDSYSSDLIDGFLEFMKKEETEDGGARHWPMMQKIASSVGAFHAPNRYEAEVVHYVLDDLEKEQKMEQRPLLVVGGQTAPMRRFLRSLAQTSPAQAHRVVLVTGDALAFNTVYRDRRATWPIQELPYSLVFFCHYNPIDSDAGFRPRVVHRVDVDDEKDDGPSPTGTEDVLLDGDIVEALAQAFQRGGKPATDAGELTERLSAIQIRSGNVGYDPDPNVPLLFTPDGNRRAATGEHVVVLRPHFDGDRVLPDATLTVYVWQERLEGGQSWQRRGQALHVTYNPPVTEERPAP